MILLSAVLALAILVSFIILLIAVCNAFSRWKKQEKLLGRW